MINETPRVRFAPSPTGYLHVGGLRTALYNYLFAKRNNGTFVLRIEDTDRNRFVPGAVENLISALNWCGVQYDEGPGKEGDCGPYIQSERLDLYTKLCNTLIENGKAYYCFCTPERLEELKAEQEKAGIQKKYDKHCLHLHADDVKSKVAAGEKYVVRLNIPDGQLIEFDDIVRGHISFQSETLDDQVLLKSDGYPTYHLANVIDDHKMRITHVIRGEEWLPSTPKHVLLYQAFGWEIPLFAHLPLLLNPDRSKLSKRQGDVAVEDYKSKGFLPDSMVNFVALLGWTAGDDKEFYSMEELINAFSLERVNKSGAVFDLNKLKWLNAEHLRSKSSVVFANLLQASLQDSPYKDGKFSEEYLIKVVDAMRERVEFVHEVWQNGAYFFTRPEAYDAQVMNKRITPNSKTLMAAYAEALSALQEEGKEAFEHALHQVAEQHAVKNAELIHPLRLALSGVGGGPGVYDIAVILGKSESIERIRIFNETLAV